MTITGDEQVTVRILTEEEARHELEWMLDL